MLSADLTPEQKIIQFIAKENAKKIWEAATVLDVTEPSPALTYLVESRGIPAAVVEGLTTRNINARVEQYYYAEKSGRIETREQYIRGAVSPVEDSENAFVGVQIVHLTNEGKKDPKFDSKAKAYIGEAKKGTVAVVQPSKNTSKVYIAEGVESAASIACIKPNAAVIACLGIDNLEHCAEYLKQNFPPDVIVVFLKDHDIVKSEDGLALDEEPEADVKFDAAYAKLVDQGFNVVVKQPLTKGADWNDVLQARVPEEVALAEESSRLTAIEEEYQYALPYKTCSSADTVGLPSNAELTKVFLNLRKHLDASEQLVETNRELQELGYDIERLIAQYASFDNQLPQQGAELDFTRLKMNAEALDRLNKRAQAIKLLLAEKYGSSLDTRIEDDAFEQNFSRYQKLFQARKDELDNIEEEYTNALFELRGSTFGTLLKNIENYPLLKTRIEDLFQEIVKNPNYDEDSVKYWTRNQLTDDFRRLRNAAKEEVVSGYDEGISAALDACRECLADSATQAKYSLGLVQSNIDDMVRASEPEQKERAATAENSYLEAMKQCQGDDKKALQQWINRAMESRKTNAGIVHQAWHSTAYPDAFGTPEYHQGDFNQEEVLLDLTREIMRRANLDPDLCSETDLTDALNLAVGLFKSFEARIPGDDNPPRFQEFDGVRLMGGFIPTIIERKANDSTGSEAVQRNFIQNKLNSKYKFFDVVPNSGYEFEIKLSTEGEQHEVTEVLQEAAKSIANDALKSMRVEFVMNKPQHDMQQPLSEVVYPSNPGLVSVRCSDTGMGNEKKANEAMDHAKKNLENRVLADRAQRANPKHDMHTMRLSCLRREMLEDKAQKKDDIESQSAPRQLL